jgi:hypothetical protein
VEWFGPAGTACVIAAVLGALAIVAIFRSDARSTRHHGLALTAMVTIGALSPILLLVGIVFLAAADSDSFRR